MEGKGYFIYLFIYFIYLFIFYFFVKNKKQKLLQCLLMLFKFKREQVCKWRSFVGT